MAPVALGIEIAEIKPILHTELDACHGARDLARHEGLAADRAFVIEENAVRGMDAIGLAIIHGDPIGIELRRRIGRARLEWRRL